MSNSTKRLQNSVAEYESLSDKKISPGSCYVVHIAVYSDEAQNIAKYFAKEKAGQDGRPLAVYYYPNSNSTGSKRIPNEIYILFFSLENNLQHNFLGSHHYISSFYASYISKNYNCDVNCSIIELDTKTKVLTYFHVKVYEATKKTLFDLARGNIKESEIENLTLGECIKIVETKINKDWDSLSSVSRHGIFYKYRLKNEKERLLTFSDIINLENTSKFETYLFSK